MDEERKENSEQQTQLDSLEQDGKKDEQKEQAEKPKKRRPVKKILMCTLIPLALILSFVGGYFSRYIFHSDKVNTAVDVVTLMEKVGYIYDVKTGEKRELTQEDIADALVYALLDEYSAYYTAQELAQVHEQAKGNLTGVGLTILQGGIVSRVTYNSPAELAGVKEGDKVLSASIDGGEKIAYGGEQDNEGELLRKALLSASVNQTVTLEIQRQDQTLSLSMVKKLYQAAYVKYYDSQKTLYFREDDERELQPLPADGGMAGLDEQTAYIRLTEFNGDADEQIEDAFEYMQIRGRTKLILDLRDNGGGYTDILEEIAGYLIYNGGKEKNLIAMAEGNRKNQYFYTDDNEFNTNITAITVLANDNTASASECLIGAMLHYGDAFNQSGLIIEKNDQGVAKTYGKGIMQTTYGLIGGGALKLTTAKMFLPDKTTSIHGVGFIPNPENAVEKGGAIARAIEILAQA